MDKKNLMCRYWLGTKIFIWIHSSARKSALLRFKDSHSNCIHKFKIFLQLTYSFQVFPRPIQLSHWHQHGAKSWISCKWLKALRKASQWQLIKCSAPSTICWRQCDIRIDLHLILKKWVWKIKFDELDFFPSLNCIFTCLFSL